MAKIALTILLSFLPLQAFAQAALLSVTGAGHPELTWSQIETPHFLIIYHQGLDTIAMKAAPMAEEVYRVVTTNLKNPLDNKIKIIISDNDEIKNAFALTDSYIFIWLRGILDDLPYGLRSSGNSKWLRSVITHEFTHIVTANASKDWTNIFDPSPNVPRWFNEGLSRFMEPDGWTTDLDALLRVGAVNNSLDLGSSDNYLSGAFMYEGGHSLIRYMVATYGDSVIPKILHYHGSFGRYNFLDAVRAATKKSLHEIMETWHKRLTVYYASAYGQKQETEEFARKLPVDLCIVLAARIAPDGKRIAAFAKRKKDSPARLFLIADDTTSTAELICDEAGIEPYLSWYPDGKSICVSKLRIGTNGDLLHDLYRVDVESGSMTRLTNDGRYEEPDVLPQSADANPLDLGKHVPSFTIVAVHTEKNHSDLVMLTDPPSTVKQITHFNDPDVQVYAPRFSPSGGKIAFSIFRSNGKRDVAILDRNTPAEALDPRMAFTVDNTPGKITYLTNDSLNNRSPIWFATTNDLVFLSHRNGIPNIYRIVNQGIQPIQMTDAAGAIFPWDWSASKDSILITSYDSRNRVSLYWLGATHKAESKPAPLLAEKYTAWRTVHFPLITRPADSLPLLTVQPSGYSSLAHISPFAITPALTSDKGPTGKRDLRYGLALTLFDPMQKHVITAFGDYGAASQIFGGGIWYLNQQLPVAIESGYNNLFGFEGSIDGRSYFQTTQKIELAIVDLFATPNSLTTFHGLSLLASYRNLTPANLYEFADTSNPTPINHVPIAYKGLDLGFNYLFSSSLFRFSFGYKHADTKLSSDLTYSRYDIGLGYHLPLDEDAVTYLGTRIKAAAQFGAQIPQEYLGFTTDEVFERGFNPNSFHSISRLRGIRRPYYGDRMILGSEELVIGSPEVGGPAFVTFFDIGSVWYNKTPTNFQQVVLTDLNKTQWLKTAGFEIRLGIEGIITIAGGVGWELVKGSKADWYFRINTGF
jgi:hypothetical protein